MKSLKIVSLQIIIFLNLNLQLFAQPGTLSRHIHIDQFGYSLNTTKIAVISNPVNGYNSGQSFAPGNVYELRELISNEQVFSAAISSWKAGATHAGSGDQVWWFDFSEYTTPGQYYIYDPQNNVHSYTFELCDSIYDNVLKAALRTFYYQRCGTDKRGKYAGENWKDGYCHFGASQDRDCRLITDQSSGTSKDLSGGWHDAGDYNKYINYADGTVHDLLFAYEERSKVWGDDFNLPESGNDMPDILDEIKWELDWMLKMQNPDGSVLHKVAVTEWQTASPPSADTAPRFYAPATASATISACGVFAHASLIYNLLPSFLGMQALADRLRYAAIKAWEWLEKNPDKIPSNYDNTGFAQNAVEDDAYQQAANQTCAAAYLLVLTGTEKYRDYFDAHYQQVHLIQWEYIYSSESDYQNGLLYYLKSTKATPDVANKIKSAYKNALNDLFQKYKNKNDPYRAYIDAYYWGSNKAKSDNGSQFMNMLAYGLDSAHHSEYSDAALGFIHYLHGVNPNNVVYLTNMADYGAEESVNEIYHGWFNDGTDWDNAQSSPYGPPPGFVPGGPNPGYTPDNAYTGPDIVPPQNQPDQKAWKDWNTGWPENSWEVTENHIPNQAAYIKLLSKFAGYELTGVRDDSKISLPGSYSLGQNYPNPFNGNTNIPYRLDSAKRIELIVYNCLGQKIETLVNKVQGRGEYSVLFKTGGLSAGVYFYMLRMPGRQQVKKMIYLP